ncbi:hypothetical protein [Paraburkholderia caffeinilytica]|nr:hypothetical protein [Paraburkholderia caffeinilytica]
MLMIPASSRYTAAFGQAEGQKVVILLGKDNLLKEIQIKKILQ